MKKIAKLIYNFFYWLDVKFGYVEDYSYETAPYCGHHFNGHKGKFTESSFHEGMGGCNLKTKNIFLKISCCSEEGWSWARPTIKTTLTIVGVKDLAGEYFKPRTFYGLKGFQNARALKRKNDTTNLVITSLKYSLC